MIGKSKVQSIYTGPRALFDPNYIPPKLLFRKKEENSLQSILADSIYDDFSLNILYQGIQGIGKKTLVNKVLNDIIIDNTDHIPLQTIKIDCKEKNLEELIISLLTEMAKYNNLNLDIASFLNSKISSLWNTLKLICKKVEKKAQLFLIFNNVEHLEPDEFKKFLGLGKELNITVISTINKVLRNSALDLFAYFDQKYKLNYFSYNELFSIFQQRTSLTFSHQIDKELIEYITDLTFEFYVPVPGKGIDIIREIYTNLKERKKLNYFEILELSQIHFDFSETIDEFSMLSFISEEDLITIVFLDNLSNFFINKSNYYITSRELKDLYDLSCEALEYKKDLNEFNNLIEMIQKIGIISHSKKAIVEKKYNTNLLDCIYFFMIINPHQLKAIIDAVFGKI